jgi:hypothetical protein
MSVKYSAAIVYGIRVHRSIVYPLKIKHIPCSHAPETRYCAVCGHIQYQEVETQPYIDHKLLEAIPLDNDEYILGRRFARVSEHNPVQQVVIAVINQLAVNDALLTAGLPIDHRDTFLILEAS